MRQAVNNLQSTYSGFGFVGAEEVFKVCDQPHPVKIQNLIKHCQKGELDQAMVQLDELWVQGYAAVDIVGTLFRVVKGMDALPEYTKLEFIRVSTPSVTESQLGTRLLIFRSDVAGDWVHPHAHLGGGEHGGAARRPAGPAVQAEHEARTLRRLGHHPHASHVSLFVPAVVLPLHRSRLICHAYHLRREPCNSWLPCCEGGLHAAWAAAQRPRSGASISQSHVARDCCFREAVQVGRTADGLSAHPVAHKWLCTRARACSRSRRAFERSRRAPRTCVPANRGSCLFGQRNDRSRELGTWHGV